VTGGKRGGEEKEMMTYAFKPFEAHGERILLSLGVKVGYPHALLWRDEHHRSEIVVFF
jgi:hypothetical protein